MSPGLLSSPLEKEGRLCQEAIYRASRRYALHHHKSMLKCFGSLTRGKALLDAAGPD